MGDDGAQSGHLTAVDQGTGVEGQPVLGLSFWVRAEEVGAAATTALKTARRAGSAVDAGPDYYDITLVPRSAVLLPSEDVPAPRRGLRALRCAEPLDRHARLKDWRVGAPLPPPSSSPPRAPFL